MDAQDLVNVSVVSNGSDEEDADFMQFTLLLAFPRNRPILRPRTDHMTMWTEDEFLQKFRLNKGVVRLLTEMLEKEISSPTTRCVQNRSMHCTVLSVRMVHDNMFDCTGMEP